jgi:glycosyltransferase AglD
MSKVMVTIPAFNEAARIESAVRALYESLDHGEYTLAIAEDGSTDGGAQVLLSLTERFPDLMVSSSPKRLGRGTALRRLWSSADADIYCYVDADLPAGTAAISDVVHAVEGGADIAVGSRYCPRASVRRPPIVRLASEIYNWTLRWSFRDGIWDHQCGLKAFSRESFTRLDRIVVDGSWFWDTEMLVIARILGMRVDEIPMQWVERRYAKTNLRRLGNEIPYFVRNTVRLRSSIEGISSAGEAA